MDRKTLNKQMKEKKAGVVILISDKTDFKTNTVGVPGWLSRLSIDSWVQLRS